MEETRRSAWSLRRFGRPSGPSLEARARDYRELFGSEVGRRVLADLAERCGLLTGAAVSAPDGMMAALEQARREGRRGVVLDILHLLGWTPMKIVAAPEEDHD